MKSRRFFSVMIMASLVLMGTTYAALTDRLQLTGTVSTGKLQITNVDKEGNIDADTGCTKFNCELDQMYPEKPYTFDIGFKNTGDIPAKIDGITLDLVSNRRENTQDSEKVFDSLEMAGTINIIKADGQKIEIEKISQDSHKKLKKVIEELNTELIGTSLDLEDTLQFENCVIIPSATQLTYEEGMTAEQGRNIGEREKVSFDIVIQFIQQNVTLSEK